MKHTLPLLLASICFGAMAVAVRVAGTELPVLQVACLRFTGSFVVLLLSAMPFGRPRRTGTLRVLVLRGLIGTVAIVLYFAGIQGAGAALATLIQNTHPVFTALLAGVIGAERPTRRIVAALALNLVGVAIVMAPGIHLGAEFVRGALCALGAAMLSAFAVTTASHLRRTESATVVTLYFMGTGAVVTAPGLASGLAWPSPGVLGALVVMILTSAVGQWLLHFALGFTSATAGSISVATSVVTAAIAEALVLGGHPAPSTWLGGTLMLGAIWLAAPR